VHVSTGQIPICQNLAALPVTSSRGTRWNRPTGGHRNTLVADLHMSRGNDDYTSSLAQYIQTSVDIGDQVGVIPWTHVVEYLAVFYLQF
jgi:hypothetical protein